MENAWKNSNQTNSMIKPSFRIMAEWTVCCDVIDWGCFRLYISGGREGKLACDGVECFSFDDNKITQLATYPSKKVFYQEFNRPQDQDFYLFGGMDYPSTSPNAASEMYRYVATHHLASSPIYTIFKCV